jgi:alpha-mannosidase
MEQAYELNIPLQFVNKRADASALPQQLFAIEALRGARPIVEAIKPAEDGKGIVLRFYENSGMPIRSKFTLAKRYPQILETNLMEKPLAVLGENTQEFEISLHPFEIKTVYLSE